MFFSFTLLLQLQLWGEIVFFDATQNEPFSICVIHWKYQGEIKRPARINFYFFRI